MTKLSKKSFTNLSSKQLLNAYKGKFHLLNDKTNIETIFLL